MLRQPLLVSFLGFPGSGKTYFARLLAEKLPAVILNSDAMRMSMFGSIERIEVLRKTDKSRLYTDVFGAMNYSARQVLRSGGSVIYDVQSSKRKDRLSLEAMASQMNAKHVLVWIKTDPRVAIQRGQERQASDDSHRYTEEKMAYLVERFDKVTDLPEPDENVVEISGEVSFDEQCRAFMKGIESLYG